MDKQITYQAILEKACDVMQRQRLEKVYPHDLLGWLPFQCSLWTVRRYMRQMSERGMLERVSYRGGYRLPQAA